MKMRRILAVLLVVIMVVALCSGCGSSKKEYPSSALTMIVNYSAGGGTDLAARALADAAAKSLGQTITVSNVTGGSGTVGIAELATHEADGYTIGVATLAPLALVPWTMEVTYTPENFDYICTFGQYGYGIVVAADSPYQTLDDLLEASKAEAVNCGATGYPQPFAMSDLNAATGSQLTFVSYPSTTDLITDILGGFIPCAVCDQASFTSYVKDGSMRLLASATDKRWDVAPDVPTLQEMGYDIALLSYMGLAMPKGADEAVVAKLREAFKGANEDPTFLEILKNSNLVATYMSGEDYEKLVYEKYAEYEVLMAEVNK